MKLDPVPKAPSECWSLLQPSDAGRRQAARTPRGFAEVPLDDLQKNAVIMAVFVYHAAMRDERIPRKQP